MVSPPHAAIWHATDSWLLISIGRHIDIKEEGPAGHEGAMRAARSLVGRRDVRPPRRAARKGNVSIGSGERIYRLPGQEYYDETKDFPSIRREVVLHGS